MADLGTRYMGLELKSPIVVAASSISGMVDRIEMAERSGAGALVIRSLFEEQIQFDAMRMEDSLASGSESFAEAISYLPELKLNPAEEHLHWIEEARAKVEMPLIASLNAVSPAGWMDYAKRLEATGVDGLELNVYSVAADPARTGTEIEAELFNILEAVRKQVSIPVAVKLSPYFTSMSNVAAQLDQRGTDALVLFNRFLQPDVDVERQALLNEMIYSSPAELKLPLRWVALLYGRIQAHMALNTGVHSGTDVAKAILVGAQVVQVASALLIHGIPYLSTMLRELEGWMDEKGFGELEDFRGRLSQHQTEDLVGFERAQYVRLLMGQ
jgi:dihydroorotate dehydrogenase (fumarate)